MARKKRAQEAPPAIVTHVPREVKVAELNYARYNPRRISAEDMASLKASIREFGLAASFVVQKGSNVLIAGHQRLRALREICEESGLPMPDGLYAYVLDLDDEQAMQLNVALNRIGGEFDALLLGRVLARIVKSGKPFNVSAMGFKRPEVDNLIRQSSKSREAAAGAGVQTFARSITMSVAFKTVEERDEAKTLIERAEGNPGEIVLDALRAAAATGRSKRVVG